MISDSRLDAFWGPPTSNAKSLVCHRDSCLQFDPPHAISLMSEKLLRGGSYIFTVLDRADYVVTRYVAEFINTLTNLVYVLYGIYGIRSLRRKANTNAFRVVPYWGLMGVGLCSAIFHLRLKYHTQMMDDLSMLFTTTPVLHRVLTVNASRTHSTILAILLASGLTGLIAVHVATDELIMHATAFAVSVTVIGIRTM
ncbi:hypothetical protein BO71DRAFT_425468 [Aspergillus ellipticus CBS 707.79]|uniref:Uncharacterized protein n=1 Tax=Aspergillus ellipticus CBS 707.79 TaxID=1448320 RepID=A0A319F2Q2_9EURO|nr:hypothetical protein BO71DRAFT_425468 [Aspergillus ellipticus CBS 707.79]